MKYRNKIMPAILALMAVVSSCTKEELPSAAQDNTDIDITAQVGKTVTRVQQTSDNVYVFEKNDTLAVVGWYGADWNTYPTPWSDANAKWWINSLCVNNGAKWVSTPQMRWQNVPDPHHFLAWWPSTFTNAGDNLSDVKVDMNKLKEKDVLVARLSTVPTPGTPINLQFEHIMARFDVNLTFAEQYDIYNNVKVSLDLQTNATVDLVAATNPVIVAGGAKTTETMPVIATKTGFDYSCSSIVVPQSLTNPVVTIKFQNGTAKTLAYTHPAFLFESGKRTTLNLTVGRDYVNVVDVTVTPWVDGGNIGNDENMAE